MANLQSFERTDPQQIKSDLHRKVLDRLDLEKLGKTSGDSARDEVMIIVRTVVNGEVVPLSFANASPVKFSTKSSASAHSSPC